MSEIYVDPASLMMADNDGMIDRRPEAFESPIQSVTIEPVGQIGDVVSFDPEIIAGDEGMFDRREGREMNVAEAIALEK